MTTERDKSTREALHLAIEGFGGDTGLSQIFKGSVDAMSADEAAATLGSVKHWHALATGHFAQFHNPQSESAAEFKATLVQVLATEPGIWRVSIHLTDQIVLRPTLTPSSATALVNFFANNWNAIELEPRVVRAEDPAGFKNRHSFVFETPAGDEVVWWICDDARLSVSWADIEAHIPVAEGMRLIERICRLVIDSVDVADAEWLRACARWRSREFGRSPTLLAGLFTGIKDQEWLRRILEIAGDFKSFRESEVLMAARMRPAEVSASDMDQILEAILRVPVVNSPALEVDSRIAMRELSKFEKLGESPQEQGYQLAQWLRRYLEIQGAFEPRDVFARWGLRVGRVDLKTRKVDAVGFWGKAHGPGVVINWSGHHSASPAARRTTLAHEICHLLVDRGAGAPPVEVLGGSVDEFIEVRAGAFSREVMVPREDAYRAFLQTDRSMHEAAVLVSTLQDRYRSSLWVATNQLRRGIVDFAEPGTELESDVLSYLFSLGRLE